MPGSEPSERSGARASPAGEELCLNESNSRLLADREDKRARSSLRVRETSAKPWTLCLYFYYMPMRPNQIVTSHQQCSAKESVSNHRFVHGNTNNDEREGSAVQHLTSTVLVLSANRSLQPAVVGVMIPVSFVMLAVLFVLESGELVQLLVCYEVEADGDRWHSQRRRASSSDAAAEYRVV